MATAHFICEPMQGMARPPIAPAPQDARRVFERFLEVRLEEYVPLVLDLCGTFQLLNIAQMARAREVAERVELD